MVKTIGVKERKKYIPMLKKCFLFNDVEIFPESRLVNEEGNEWMSFDKGEVIYNYDNYKNSLGIILKGRVSVEKGRRHGSLFNTLKTGEAFGGAILFSDGPFIAKISAQSVSDILFISSDLMRELMSFSNEINMNYIRYLTDSLRFLNERLEIFSAGGAFERTVRYLEIKSHTDENGLTVADGISMSSLAEYLAVGRATLYRILREMEKDSLIRKEGRKIYLLKGEEL